MTEKVTVPFSHQLLRHGFCHVVHSDQQSQRVLAGFSFLLCDRQVAIATIILTNNYVSKHL